MLVVGGGLCPGTSINDRQADRTPGQPLTKSCSPCPQPQPGVPSPRRWRAESPPPPHRGGDPARRRGQMHLVHARTKFGAVMQLPTAARKLVLLPSHRLCRRCGWSRAVVSSRAWQSKLRRQAGAQSPPRRVGAL